MEKSLVKLMRPYTTKLVKKGTVTRYHSDVMRFLRPCQDNNDFIIVEVDKGYYDKSISFWRKDLQEERISTEDVEPCIIIRFITPDYKTLCEVTDFDFVEFDTYDFINGEFIKNGTEKRRVIADDCGSHDLFACHFHFEGSECYHICEFAERVNPDGDRVRPIKISEGAE